jgi:hypothetical protein
VGFVTGRASMALAGVVALEHCHTDCDTEIKMKSSEGVNAPRTGGAASVCNSYCTLGWEIKKITRV